MKSFAELFKKYRLRAEFETISSFSDALAEKGYFYDESIFSHWQKGTRLPTSRDLVLKLIAIFNERRAIQTLHEANEFLESTHHGYLTTKEQEEFNFAQDYSPPFQVPSEIVYFIGRERIVEKITKEISAGNILLLHGPPGVGKTALAIKLGHLLSKKYSDGVLWYKVDSTNVMDILLSIARLFGEDISTIKDMEVRASIVRTLLSKKRLLLIFDNVTNEHALNLVIPNSPNSSLIFTSQESTLNISNKYKSIAVTIFTEQETIELFSNIFDKKYVSKNSKEINQLAEKLGHLPLALQMAANYMKQSNVSIQSYISQLQNESIDLQQMKYEDKNLFGAISISFNMLNSETKVLFTTLGMFEGKDFSLIAVAYVNKLSESKTRQFLQNLIEMSLVEESSEYRFRIHPLIKLFARKQLKDPSYYLKAAQYYEQLLARANEKPVMKVLRLEVDNIIYIFKQCYEKGYWDQIITLWNPLQKFLSDNNELKKLRLLTETIDTSPRINTLQKIFTFYLIVLVVYWIILAFSEIKYSHWNSLYSLLFTLFPVTGGIIGIVRSKSWGLFRTNIGRAVFFISVGLFSWGFGNLVWAYYNFVLNTIAPYPSFADAGYIPSYIFLCIGILYLSRATGANFSFSRIKKRLPLLLIPFGIIFLASYFLFFVINRSIESKTLIRAIFDLYYPSMDIVILSLAVIVFGLSVNFFGGKYKISLYAILLGFSIQCIGDFIFTYVNAIGVFYNGGPADLFFSIGLFLISWGTLSFYLTPRKSSISLH